MPAGAHMNLKISTVEKKTISFLKMENKIVNPMKLLENAIMPPSTRTHHQPKATIIVSAIQTTNYEHGNISICPELSISCYFTVLSTIHGLMILVETEDGMLRFLTNWNLNPEGKLDG